MAGFGADKFTSGEQKDMTLSVNIGLNNIKRKKAL